mgnify:CR=1 FL=1
MLACAVVTFGGPHEVGAQSWNLVRESKFPLPTQITRPRSMARLPDGTIAMLDVRAPFLHLVGPTGRHLGALLGAGEGPGSARMPMTIGAAGTDIWVWDPGNGRLTVLSPSGKVVREVPLRVEGSVSPLGPNRFLAVPLTAFGAGMDSVRTIRLAVLDSAGRTTATLFSYTDIVKSLVIPSVGGARVGRQPLRPSALPLSYPGEYGIAVVFPTVEDRGQGQAFRLVRFSPSGALLFDKWIAFKGIPVGQHEIADALRLLSSGPDSSGPGRARRVRAALAIPKYLAAASVGLLGPDGETWLREFSLGPGGRRWFVVSGQGRVIGRIEVPMGEQVVGLLNGLIATTSEDSNGEPELSLYRVVRRR